MIKEDTVTGPPMRLTKTEQAQDSRAVRAVQLKNGQRPQEREQPAVLQIKATHTLYFAV